MGNLMGSWRYKEPTTVEECDSTWETDSESDELQPGGEEEDSGISESMSPADAVRGAEQLDHGSPKFGDMMESSTRMKRSFYAAKDLYKYRHSYPNYKEPRRPNEYRNLRFYLNKIPLVPDGIYIEEILTKWRGDYEKLEHNHTYIQWLFPLREQGLNFYAQELTQDEIKEFQSTREAKRRFLLAYTIMLDFFGIKLLDKNGNVARAPNCQDRFQHLNESQHNYLRITRILKSLGELGFESFKLPLVRLLLEEALVEGTLPNMRHSALEYFIYTLRQHSQRRALLRFAQRHYQPPENFIWGPPKKKRIPASGSTGMKSGKNEVVEKSVGKARSPREGRNNLEREADDMDDRKSGEWKTAKGSKVLQEGRGRVDLEEYIETIPL
ncbi:opioid growth factor receptor-like protein 1 [Sinocyclocheilus rhinocerous]|uniref:opioid growth factor receptor-like protein 1 n=1 Tax=Sinocyclocheilus rhinocerous TaxID=307959 RepID=UPI0007B8ABD7|nr:PREDICTED: opioid growth factor receptor-like protein 1 [Sinocyclocheilus rhinocerous]